MRPKSIRRAADRLPRQRRTSRYICSRRTRMRMSSDTTIARVAEMTRTRCRVGERSPGKQKRRDHSEYDRGKTSPHWTSPLRRIPPAGLTIQLPATLIRRCRRNSSPPSRLRLRRAVQRLGASIEGKTPHGPPGQASLRSPGARIGHGPYAQASLRSPGARTGAARLRPLARSPGRGPLDRGLARTR
jgi:hypothetical protein